MIKLAEYSDNLIEKTYRLKRAEIEEFIKKSNKNCVCFGDGLMCMPMASRELKEDGFNIKYIVDDIKGGCGKYSCGLELVSRDDARLPDRPYYICTTRRVAEVYSSLMKDGEDNIGGFISYAQYLSCKHYEKYIDVRDNYLVDEKSKMVFNMVLYALLTDYYNNELEYERNQYFAIREFDLWMNETFVDVGSSFGDFLDKCLEHAMGRFVKYIAFEPGDVQFAALERRARRIKDEWGIEDSRIILEKKGVGSSTRQLDQNEIASVYTVDGFSNTNQDCSKDKIQIVSLDDYFGDEDVSFIKADIEGMEMDMINGASCIISTRKPKIAVCAYHLPNDIYTLPIRIREINPDYKFSLRCHSKNYEEIVLYAY
jgi:FkbM family methyltransferase